VRAIPAAVAVRLRVRVEMSWSGWRRGRAAAVLLVGGVALTGAVKAETGGAAAATALTTGQLLVSGLGLHAGGGV